MSHEIPHLTAAKRLAAALRHDGIELSPAQVELASLVFLDDECERSHHALLQAGVRSPHRPCPHVKAVIDRCMRCGTEGAGSVGEVSAR
jgi:hypothetical protein